MKTIFRTVVISMKEVKSRYLQLWLLLQQWIEDWLQFSELLYSSSSWFTCSSYSVKCSRILIVQQVYVSKITTSVYGFDQFYVYQQNPVINKDRSFRILNVLYTLRSKLGRINHLKRNYKQSLLLIIDPKHYILLYFSMHLEKCFFQT